jgi:hypothetical protein
VQVEQDHLEEQDDEEEVPEHHDEVEQEEEGSEQEEHPRYTTYHDIFKLEGNINNMNHLANNLRDTSYNLLQQFASWNPLGYDGTYYPPPQ